MRLQAHMTDVMGVMTLGILGLLLAAFIAALTVF
jgi:hypothetical protein